MSNEVVNLELFIVKFILYLSVIFVSIYFRNFRVEL
jgi:hypothetical protein